VVGGWVLLLQLLLLRLQTCQVRMILLLCWALSEVE
jgi:hypothetical protein